jgi:MtN3 and saliva related transmembrane protein
MSFVDVLGYTAGFVTSLTFLPQVIKTLKDKSAKDISLTMFVIAALNEVMWIAYGILLTPMNWVIIATNSVVLTMSVIMIILKLRYNNNATQNSK